MFFIQSLSWERDSNSQTTRFTQSQAQLNSQPLMLFTDYKYQNYFTFCSLQFDENLIKDLESCFITKTKRNSRIIGLFFKGWDYNIHVYKVITVLNNNCDNFITNTIVWRIASYSLRFFPKYLLEKGWTRQHFWKGFAYFTTSHVRQLKKIGKYRLYRIWGPFLV
jgi:hypothetical protein